MRSILTGSTEEADIWCKAGLNRYWWNGLLTIRGAATGNIREAWRGITEPEYLSKYFSNDRKEAVAGYENYLKQVALETDDEKKAEIY
jgi:hypothetical protein